VIVLSGYGVTVDLNAETFISKTGITSSTFRTLPDVPIDTFELTLPQGRYSALAANGKLCASTLKMPTAFTAQDGAVIHQSTPVSVTGCPKRKRAHKPSPKRRKSWAGPAGFASLHPDRSGVQRWLDSIAPLDLYVLQCVPNGHKPVGGFCHICSETTTLCKLFTLYGMLSSALRFWISATGFEVEFGDFVGTFDDTFDLWFEFSKCRCHRGCERDDDDRGYRDAAGCAARKRPGRLRATY
jgi:hypothetical protein